MNNSEDLRDLPPLYNHHAHSTLYHYLSLSLVGVVISALAKLISIPHQIPAILCGLSFGALGVATRSDFEFLGLNASVLLSMYVPLVITKITYKMENYLLLKSLSQISLITVVGNLIFIPSLGVLIKILQSTDVSFLEIILLVLILTPNECPDMFDLDSIKNLETMMCGESIMGISLCFTCSTICLGIDLGHIVHWYQIISVFIRYTAVAIPIGYIFGLMGAAGFRRMYNDSINAVCMIFGSSYFVYNLCEHVIFCSGPLASFITLYYITLERTRLLTKIDHDVKLCINVTFYFAQTFLIVIYSMFIFYSWLHIPRFYDMVEAIAAYIIGNVLRLIMYLILSPALSRIGYGFDFTSLVTIFWAVQKGPIQLIQVLIIREDYSGTLIAEEVLYYTMVFVLFTYVINSTTLKLFLKRFGLIQLSNRRKSNVNIAINAMNDTANRVLAMLKMNRFYSDANWAVIYAHTKIESPFNDYNIEQMSWQKESVICKVCNAIVPLDTSLGRYDEHFKDITLRVLKAQRVSFVKQHETGFLSKMDVRLLLQAVEVAMDSTDMNIKLDSLFACIDDQFSRKSMRFLQKAMKIFAIDSSIKIPKSGIRKYCFYIDQSLTFKIINYMIIYLNFIVIIMEIEQFYTKFVFWTFFGIDIACTLFFIFEICIKVIACWDTTFRAAVHVYLKGFWDKIDVISVIFALVDITMDILGIFRIAHYIPQIIWLRMILVLKMAKVLNTLCPTIVAYIERRKDLQLMNAFVVATGIVISCEEVINNLPSFTEHSNIQEILKTNLLKTRSAITQKLGILEKERPSLTTTIKTMQVLRSILKFLRKGMQDLKTSGLIDAFEYNKLNNSINSRQKYLDNLKMMEVIQPKAIFDEIPWLHSDDYLLQFIYSNVKTKIFNAGDVLCHQGDIPDGVYIIVAGYFKVTYYPSVNQMEKLELRGELPIKEFLEYMRFGEIQEDYLSCGNRMGELAVLTNRPYSCSIISEAPSQAFIIPREILQQAMKESADPILGLGAKIWKCILLGLGRRILRTTPTYQSAPPEHIDFAMHRAVVPNISYYSVISLSQVVEDVLLLEGLVVDFNTREIFIAPCAIPRHVTKLIMPLSTLVTMDHITTKLMFFPASNVEEYEMMQIIEQNSELLPDHDCVTLTANPHANKRSTKKILQSHIFSARHPISGASFYSNKGGISSHGLVPQKKSSNKSNTAS